jgi:lysozyme
MSLIEDLKRHEGFRAKPYRDTTGHLTLGYGFNLDTTGISQTEATMILEHRIKILQSQLRQRLPFWSRLSQNRQDVLVNMAYNLGIEALLEFKKTLQHIASGEYREAGDQMLRSLWAKQVGKRAVELADMMRNG